MALTSTPTLTQINAALSTSGKSLSQCIALAGKTGTWAMQSNFAYFVAQYLSVSPTSSINLTAFGQTTEFTITSNISWTAAESVTWLTLSATSGTGNKTVNVNVVQNFNTIPRNTTITITSSLGSKYITIYQEAADGGEPPI